MAPSPPRRAVASRAKPPARVAGWETAGLAGLVAIAQDAGATSWLADLTRRLGLSRGAFTRLPPARLIDLVVLLHAQVAHWREEAARLDTPANRKRARRGLAREVARSIMEYQHAPDAATLTARLDRLNVTTGHAADRGLIFYDWQADLHDGAGLRRALGYSPARFRVLAKEICARPAKPGQPPMKVEHSGRGTIYPRTVALLLLLHRLAHVARDRRATLATGIWQWRMPHSRRGDAQLSDVLEIVLGCRGLRRAAR